MAFQTRKTVLLSIGACIVKVTPLGGRLVAISAPQTVTITDRKGRKLTNRRQKR